MIESNIIQIKIIRHSDRLDYSNPFKWMCYFGHYWNDTPLSSKGYVNAKNKALTLSIQGYYPAYIYTSPYSRTMATATEIKSIFPASEIIVEPLLCEYQPTYKHTIPLYPKGIPTDYEGVPTEFVYPETPEMFTNRVRFIITKLVEKNSKDIIIVTHGELLKSFINYLQNIFPNMMLNANNVPYLTVLSFSIDKNTMEFIEDSIQIEY
jgi:broad specificity phosphatase PhoE